MLAYQDTLTSLHLGDVRACLGEMPAQSVHCVITSPPYWGLRSYTGVGATEWGGDPECNHRWGEPTYGWVKGEQWGKTCAACGAWWGHLGLEPTPDQYVAHLVEVFAAVWRVLRDDGVCWLNLGDCFAGSGGAHKAGHQNPGLSKSAAREGVAQHRQHVAPGGALKSLDLVGIPWLVAFALRAAGWYLRADAVWDKPNPMPESVAGWRWERCRVKAGGG